LMRGVKFWCDHPDYVRILKKIIYFALLFLIMNLYYWSVWHKRMFLRR
jgi:hypothetical protein